MRIVKLSLLVAGLLGCVSEVAAKGEIEFRGILNEAPPCRVNSGSDIPEVDFGLKVGVKKVNGSNYMQVINYDLDCDPNTSNWGLTLKITGDPTTFDNAAVQTDSPGLGIRILRDGIPFELGKDIPITLANKPRLEAVPVQQPGVLLTEGPFSASATLRAEYQ